MSSEIFILLENTNAESNDSAFLYSDKRPGAGYHKSLDNLHTAVYSVVDFLGGIKLQATLAVDPSDTDWFDINNTQVGGSENTLISGDSSIFGTQTLSVNFSGNFVWVRAAYNVQNGAITKISYTF
jgi:hypothetical protein